MYVLIAEKILKLLVNIFLFCCQKKKNKSLLIPAGFAHGFYALEDNTILLYQCSKYRHAKSETGILWKDKDLGIKWPVKKLVISKKDKINMSFKDFKKLI